MSRGFLANLRFRLYYWLWVRWIFHGLFNDEDRLMVDVMDAPPERLYRPDVSITEWRRLCEDLARPLDYGWLPQPMGAASPTTTDPPPATAAPADR
jgi:hypothetical protein